MILRIGKIDFLKMIPLLKLLLISICLKNKDSFDKLKKQIANKLMMEKNDKRLKDKIWMNRFG